MGLHFHTEWYWLAFGFAVLAVSLYFSFRTIGNVAKLKKRVLVMEVIRTAAVVLAALTLLQPEIIIKTVRKSEPEIAILADVSDSMKTLDEVVASESGVKRAVKRSEWVKSVLENKFYSPLEKRFKVSVQPFAMPPDGDGKKTGIPTGGTDFDYALSRLLKGYDNLRAVILLSDGDWNYGKSPIGAAATLKMSGVKIYPVPVGSRNYLPDVELMKIRAPAFCLSNEKIAIPFQVKNRTDNEYRTKITLSSNFGEEGSKDLLLPPGETVSDSIIWQPKHDGLHSLTLSVPVQSDEVIAENNKHSFTINVKKEVLKVLIVESYPRWEYRYLRNALMRDPGVEVNTLLFHPALGHPGGGKGYIAKFPSKEKLSGYDVVFLGDVGIGSKELTQKDAELLAGLVKYQGSGLVFLPGYQGRQLTLQNSKLDEMYPVELDRKHPGGYSSGIESKMELTGRGRGHFLLMLADTPEKNSYVWRHLPGFFWNAAVAQEKAGTTVLAVHSGLKCNSGRMPIIAVREYGNGNVLFMGIDSAWRWRKGVEDKYHYRFWGQVVRWMAHKRHLAHENGIRCFFVPETPKKNHRVYLYATLNDRVGRPIDNSDVTVTVKPETGGRAESFSLVQEKKGWGMYKGSFTPKKQGRYSVNIKAPDHNLSISLPLDVAGVKREKIGQPMRVEIMRELAAITQGKVFTPDQLDMLIKTINALPKQIEIEKRVQLWCTWWWGALILLLLSAYWVLRKLNGMI